MVDIYSKKCRSEGCGKQPSFGVAGTKTAEYCAQHSPDGMVNVCSRKCGVAQHAEGGMVNFYDRKCRTETCGKQLSFGVANSRTVEYCAQHARLQCRVEGYREREVVPHHSRKKPIGNVISSGAKHTTVHFPTKTSTPSSVSRDSRKRVRHPKITSTASKRAFARESTAGALTVPDIDEQPSPVKRISSVKAEVQLSL
ncbi:unnamed protein product [Ascophyllum nodosum]